MRPGLFVVCCTSILCVISLAQTAPTLANSSFDGSIELEHRLFFDKSVDEQAARGQSSARLLMEYVKDWNSGDDQIVFEPFVRLDSDDSERSHGDIRQFAYTHYGKKSEFTMGISRVFWGVTESQHLVDIVNQTDAVENIDGEDKLGQPMMRYAYFSDVGTFDAFLLPYFRERTFVGADGRLNGGLLVDTDNPVFESSSEQSNLDHALRYSNTWGDWGVGLSWFSGTSREADLLRLADFATGRTQPYYPQIDQLGADVQLTTGAWLLKFEGVQRNFDDTTYADYAAATLGFEYTLVGLFGSVYDLGLLGEYSWDERNEMASSVFQDDLFVGGRLLLNDVNDSQVLFGLINDLDNSDSRSIFLEASSRIASSFTVNIELRYFDSDTPADPLFRFKDDSFIQIGVAYFFD